MKTPKNMFTTAVSPHNDDHVVLLFNHLRKAPDNFPEVLRDMQQHPVLKETCRLGVVVPPDAKRDEFQVTTDIDPFLVPGDYTDNEDATIYLGDETGGATTLNMVETYYSCNLPHREFVGCNACMEMDTVTNCTAKEWYIKHERRRRGDIQNWHIFGDPDQVRTQLKNRKDNLGGFTYISSRLTLSEGQMCIPPPQGRHESSTRHCKPIDRTPDEHDFSGVAHHSDVVSRSVMERVRFKRFKAEVCPTCLTHKPCHDMYDNRWCHGPYDMTEEQAADKILSEHEIPYDDIFLATLLRHHCGELPFRMNTKMAHLSCEIAPMERTLKFGLVYDYAGYFEALELNELTDLTKRLYQHPITSDPLTRHERAILIELARNTYSPRENGHRHKTQYRSLFINYTVSKQFYTPGKPACGLELHFRFNTKRKDRDMEMPWTIQATCLGDIYGHYQSLQTIQKTEHPMRKVYGETFRG